MPAKDKTVSYPSMNEIVFPEFKSSIHPFKLYFSEQCEALLLYGNGWCTFEPETGEILEQSNSEE